MLGHRIVASAALVTLASSTAAAQQPSASARAFGMGDSYSAEARGFDAVAWNPAMLGMPGAPRFSISVLTLGGTSGLDPIKYGDITAFGGEVIPAATKEEWLTRIGSGRERGSIDGGISFVALSVGRFAFQAGVVGAGEANLNQDAAEAILFGNAGRTGTARAFAFAGSEASGSAIGVAAASLALPTSWKPTGRPGEAFSIGVTGKYLTAVGLGRAQDNGSVVTPDNIQVAFPAIYTRSEDYALGDAGSGAGLDVGMAWSDGRTTFGLTARNVVNTFEWATEGLVYTRGTVDFDGTTNVTDFSEQPYSAAPQSMRTALEEETFKPEIAVGFSRRMPLLTLTADAKQRFGDGIAIGPKMHVGVGAEFRGIPILPLRAGVAAITDGFQAAAGAGLKLGPVELGAGFSMRSRNSATEYGAMFSLLSIR